MYSKKHLILTAACTAVIVCLVCISFFLWPGGYASYDTVMRAKTIITENYVNSLTEEQQSKLTDLAIQGMVYALGDQYSRYYNTEDLEEYAENHAESYMGLGISINFNAETGSIQVISPYDDSPAQKAGVLPGDEIVRVDELEVSAETYDEVLDYIKSGEHESVCLHINRGGKALTLTVTPEEVRQQSVSHKMFGGGLGYIRISEFIASTDSDFKKAVEELRGQEMRGLIIDLRSNPGGYAQTVISATDSLLPEGVIAYLEDNHGDRDYFYSDKEALSVPMAVLINRGTASAAELMAGSLKAHGLATVIGEKSYGKAVGQSMYPLTGTTALYLTDARYFTPNGECIDGVGIEPDIEVSLADELLGKISILEPDEDAQLAKAIEVLSAKTAE